MAEALHRSSAADPGIRRRRAGKGFTYHDERGELVRDATTLDRIRALAIPPAWTDVWICADPAGHLQATGLDRRGRRQPRYHSAFRAERDARKFRRLASFGAALPRLRRAVARDLHLEGMPRRRVLAAVVRLLDRGAGRIGDERYVRQNASFGLTTLRRRHARVHKDQVDLRYRGKGHRKEHLVLEDHAIALVVRRASRSGGSRLFRYRDEGGRWHAISRSQVNAYIRHVMGQSHSAKDFRTWAATVAAAQAVEIEQPAGTARARRAAALSAAAERIGDTPTVARNAYVHPRVLAMLEQLPGRRPPPLGRRVGPRAAEAEVLRLLGRRTGARKTRKDA